MTYRPFFEAETVRTTRDLLARLLRTVFYLRGVSTNDFVRFHGEYWNHWNRAGQDESESTHRSNQRRTLLEDTISWKKFRWIIADLLRLDVVALSITVRSSDGKEITYSTRDKIEDQPIAPVAPLPYSLNTRFNDALQPYYENNTPTPPESETPRVYM